MNTLFNPIRESLCIGYTFIFKGDHCTVTGFRPTYFTYSTNSRRYGNYMHYNFFSTIPHFISKHKIRSAGKNFVTK